MTPITGVADALARVRQRGLKTAVVTNQSGVARGCFDIAALRAMHDRLDELLGPFDAICACPHDDRSRCACRKPEPGLVLEAADAVGVPPDECAVIGDTIA